jgi:hypothetical protein
VLTGLAGTEGLAVVGTGAAVPPTRNGVVGVGPAGVDPTVTLGSTGSWGNGLPAAAGFCGVVAEAWGPPSGKIAATMAILAKARSRMAPIATGNR